MTLAERFDQWAQQYEQRTANGRPAKGQQEGRQEGRQEGNRKAKPVYYCACSPVVLANYPSTRSPVFNAPISPTGSLERPRAGCAQSGRGVPAQLAPGLAARGSRAVLRHAATRFFMARCARWQTVCALAIHPANITSQRHHPSGCPLPARRTSRVGAGACSASSGCTDTRMAGRHAVQQAQRRQRNAHAGGHAAEHGVVDSSITRSGSTPSLASHCSSRWR